MSLRRDQKMVLAERCNPCAGSEPKRLRRPEVISIKTDARSNAPHPPPAITQMHCHRMLRLARHDPDRPAHTPVTETQFNDVSGHEPAEFRQGRAHKDGIIPGEFAPRPRPL